MADKEGYGGTGFMEVIRILKSGVMFEKEVIVRENENAVVEQRGKCGTGRKCYLKTVRVRLNGNGTEMLFEFDLL